MESEFRPELGKSLVMKGICLFIHSSIKYLLSFMWSLAFCPSKGMGLNPEGTWEPLRHTEQEQHISLLITVPHSMEPQSVPWSTPRGAHSAAALAPGQPFGSLGRACPLRIFLASLHSD